jgi:signal transduction histidine kinase
VKDTYVINNQSHNKDEIRDAIKEVLKPFSLDIGKNRLNIHISEASFLPHEVTFDLKLYKEILFNIIYNAVKFNKRDGSIVIKFDFDAASSSFYTQVTDSGIGISEYKQRNLFYAFKGHIKEYQNLNLQRGSFQSGVGIGLSNSKALVEYMGGKIELQSKLQEFTKVRFGFKINPVFFYQKKSKSFDKVVQSE